MRTGTRAVSTCKGIRSFSSNQVILVRFRCLLRRREGVGDELSDIVLTVARPARPISLYTTSWPWTLLDREVDLEPEWVCVVAEVRLARLVRLLVREVSGRERATPRPCSIPVIVGMMGVRGLTPCLVGDSGGVIDGWSGDPGVTTSPGALRREE